MTKRFSQILSLFFLPTVLGLAAIQVPQSSLSEPKKGIYAEDETTVMGHLMENTAQQLEVQKQMHQLMLDFRIQKDEFARGNQTKSHAARMVRTARQIYEGITAHHLQYLFSQEYLEELLFFSSIAGKNRIKGA